MQTYIFEIQNCIKVSVIAENEDEAREDMLDNLESLTDDMIRGCVVSNGEQG